MDLLILALLGVMPALVIVGGLNDLTTMKIPNWISGLLVLSFFPAALVVGLPFSDMAVHVGVGTLALFAGAGMFALRWIGGGDAKLMAAACLWLGVSGSGMFLLWTGVAGGVFCLALLFARFHARPYLASAPGWVAQLMEPKGDIPYGVAIAAGALLAWPESPLMLRFIGA
ncbi:prepilin peptidase [Brevundimonas sp.]|uniref:A24 family peptidase n=1 Tax=Brevundimonas sp. TaxID=1871086 RepID=UPI0035B16BD7